jgi:hypothetical protein
VLTAVGAWNFGGGYLWRSYSNPHAAVPLRISFANESGGSIRLVNLKMGDEPHPLNLDLPTKAKYGSFSFDFAQKHYVEHIDVEYRSGDTATLRRASFISDARRDGECESTVSFGDPVSETVTVSKCEPIRDADSVPWDPK